MSPAPLDFGNIGCQFFDEDYECQCPLTGWGAQDAYEDGVGCCGHPPEDHVGPWQKEAIDAAYEGDARQGG